MTSCDLRMWPVLRSLESSFISSIHIAIVFGANSEEALVATKDRMVYGIGSSNSRFDHVTDKSTSHQKIDALCGKHIKTFAKGQSFICALTGEGQVYVCLYSDQSDYEFFYQDLTFKLITHSTKITHIACTASGALVLTDTGIVHTWNENSQKKESFDDKEVRVCDTKIIHISCGYSFVVIVTENGNVYSWGCNDRGQLGVGDYTRRNDKCNIAGLSRVVIEKVVCGYSHTLALSSKGFLYVWGCNKFGQLGISLQNNVVFPNPQKLKVPKMGRVYDIAACWCQSISVAMGEANRVFIWGYCLDKAIDVPTLTPLRCLHDSFAFYKSVGFICRLLIVNDEKETNVMGSMEEAFDDASTSDLIIQVHGKPIHVHKVVLKIRSHYFRTMFQEHWMENSQSVIAHEQFSYDVYKSFLKYLYTNEVDLSQENVLELLDLADTYSEDLLKRRCLQIITNEITVENVMLFYDASIKHNVKELEEYCFKFATYHISEVAQTASFAELNESRLKTFIIKAANADAFEAE